MRWDEGGQLQTNPVATTEEIFENFFQKPLDKSHKVWYNEYVIKRGKPLLKIKMGGDLSAA